MYLNKRNSRGDERLSFFSLLQKPAPIRNEVLFKSQNNVTSVPLTHIHNLNGIKGRKEYRSSVVHLSVFPSSIIHSDEGSNVLHWGKYK